MGLTKTRLMEIIREEILHHQTQQINEEFQSLILEDSYDSEILKETMCSLTKSLNALCSDDSVSADKSSQ